MPLIDKPLPELLEYRGRNPRPDDYDDYWAAALRELDATDPRPELRPSTVAKSHQVECFDLWFTGVGGARIYAKYLRPKSAAPSEDMHWRDMAGRLVAGVEIRIALDDETIAPPDGVTVGEIEIRGPWVTASYYKDPSTEKFHDGWLRTGDMGTLDLKGFVRITDRTKDVIKSGGEWVSSLDLENAIMAHPSVLEAAVIAVPDPKWDERPMACVVLREGASATVDELKSFLDGRVAKWWVPERWAFIDSVPKTSVGKFDKKVLRAQREDGTLVETP